MSFLLRSALLIGVIFFLSPVREGAEEDRSTTSQVGTRPLAAVNESLAEAVGSADTAKRALALWQMLDDETRRRLVEALTGWRAEQAPSASRPGGRDTLNELDRAVPWRGPDAGRG